MKSIAFYRMLCIGFFLCMLFGQNTWANNIQVLGKPKLVNKNIGAKTVDISFPLRWDNSWRTNTPNNWDAAWIFAKYKEGGADWVHIYIDTLSTAHRVKGNVALTIKTGISSVPISENGTTVERTKGLGVFLYRTDNGRGSVICDTIALKWKYVDQGLDDEAIVSLRVFAIEMVYVPQGAFEPGDRTSDNRAITSLGNSGIIQLGSSIFREPIGPDPATGWTSIFKMAGTVTFPTGAQNTVGNGSNGAPAGWYREISTNGAQMWRNNTNQYAAGTSALSVFTMNPTAYVPSTGQYYCGSGGVGAVQKFIIKMPAPFKASNAYFAGHNYAASWLAAGHHEVNRFMVRARKDTINWASYEDGKWVNLGGDLTTNILPLIPFRKPYSLELNPVLRDTFSYYEFVMNSAGNTSYPYAIFSALGISDEIVGGFPENNAYYYNRTYTGKMPIVWAPTQAKSSMTYPNGYEAFYMMKYELSQHAYVDFLNTLTAPQQKNRAGVDPSSGIEGAFHATNTTTPPTTYRNYVMLKTRNAGEPALYYCYQSNTRPINDYNQQGGNIAMCYMNWADMTAYFCWSGLRPLTELEYEKACKGPTKPFSGMFAWGTSNAVMHTSIETANAYTSKESVLPTNANFIAQNHDNRFPARVGCLATQSSTRSDAGAAYYGALNMSDNVTEFYINCEHINALRFDGAHGTGILDGNGEAQMATWPANNGTDGALMLKSVSNTGGGTVGGQVAWRAWSNWTSAPSTARYSWAGCRGGRTAPR